MRLPELLRACLPQHSFQWWRRRWRLAMARRLFVSVGEAEQITFVPRTTKDRQPGGQCPAASETHRYGDGRKPRRRGIDLAVIAGQIRTHVADDRRRIA